MIPVIILTVFYIVFLQDNSYAYIDPGTSSSIFSVLAPIASFFIVILGFLFKPIIRFCKKILSFLSGKFKKAK